MIREIGQWRTAYFAPEGRSPQAVEVSGELPDGTQFTTMEEFKQQLLQRKASFYRCLTEKLLIYGMGRGLHSADQETIAEITDRLASQGDGLRDLVEIVVLSPLFQKK